VGVCCVCVCVHLSAESRTLRRPALHLPPSSRRLLASLQMSYLGRYITLHTGAVWVCGCKLRCNSGLAAAAFAPSVERGRGTALAPSPLSDRFLRPMPPFGRSSPRCKGDKKPLSASWRIHHGLRGLSGRKNGKSCSSCATPRLGSASAGLSALPLLPRPIIIIMAPPAST
jgi:hypothetical protein